MKRKLICAVLTFAALLSLGSFGASAKTAAAGQTVGTVLFYITNSAGDEILVSEILVSEMEADMQNGKIDDKIHNYSVLDRFVTTVHQEAQGFTVGEFISYAQSKSDAELLRNLKLTFDGGDKIAFWEIDQNGYDDLDTYTYTDLYGAARYNFPLIYQFWNYNTQDYYDPAGMMSREEVIDHIFANGQPEVFLLSVRGFSQRYMITDEKFEALDYNMENYWSSQGLLDNARTLRMMKPMTEAELYGKIPTASDTRYWVANVMLEMAALPNIAPLGTVSAPSAVMTEDAENYYIRFSCETPGASILYNHNFYSPSYAPTSLYSGGAVAIPKAAFPSGTVTMTARAVKEGYTDAGLVTLSLKSSGVEEVWQNPFSDVAAGDWHYDYVEFVMENGLFDAMGSETFAPNAPMTRAMLVTALYRHAGSPAVSGAGRFVDVPDGAACANAVAWAYENGVVNGISETQFAPEEGITREQIVTMFHRYAEKVAKADMSANGSLAAFADAGKLSPYAENSMRWAVGAGLINGMTETEISPQGTATRAQVAAMLMRFAEYIA